MNATLRQWLPLFVLLLAATLVHGQGVFVFGNPGARTRIGSIDGPAGSTNIYAQMRAGAQPDSLSPVGFSFRHGTNGGVFAGTLTVPGIPAYNYGYVQMLAWDSALWGTELAGVPPDQFGRTDIVSVYLTSGSFPDVIHSPLFTQSAIIPVPEPSAWALGVLGALVLLPLLRRRRS